VKTALYAAGSTGLYVICARVVCQRVATADRLGCVPCQALRVLRTTVLLAALYRIHLSRPEASMSDRCTPVTGPHPIHVDRTPMGVTLDVSAYLRDVILDLIRDEAEALEDIAEWDGHAARARINDGNDDSHAAHERDALVEELVERLAPRLPVYGREVHALADRLRQSAGPVPVTARHQAGAA
jgi:hypothetical protein